MTSLFPLILFGVFALLLAIAMITSAIIAHRGKRFWGTWMMLAGSIGLVVGTLATSAASMIIFRSATSSSSSGMDQLAIFSLISGIATLLSTGSLLIYLVGLLGLAIRYGALSKRVDDLEAINASLISQNERPSS